MRVNQFPGDTRQLLGILRALPMMSGNKSRRSAPSASEVEPA
jgi:hypothetical protein